MMDDQRVKQRQADRHVLDVCKVFNDMQTGPNPVTPAEVDKLIEKRPDVYGVLSAWGTKCQSR